LASALEDYSSHYGHPPEFLSPPEVSVSLEALGERFTAALQGVETERPIDPLNPDNVRFYVFDASERDGEGHLLDAFGGRELFAMGRSEKRFSIPPEAFPEKIRDLVPAGGVPAPFALWSLSVQPSQRGTSWQ
jgi:hypothetical protein